MKNFEYFDSYPDKTDGGGLRGPPPVAIRVNEIHKEAKNLKRQFFLDRSLYTGKLRWADLETRTGLTTFLVGFAGRA